MPLDDPPGDRGRESRKGRRIAIPWPPSGDRCFCPYSPGAEAANGRNDRKALQATWLTSGGRWSDDHASSPAKKWRPMETILRGDPCHTLFTRLLLPSMIISRA
jgi:hypothetical protein